jgi:hypothetical protein
MPAIKLRLFPSLPSRERNGLQLSLGLLVGGALIFNVIFHGMMITAFDSAGHDGYVQLARSLIHGQGYRFQAGGPLVVYRPPGYVALLLPIVLFPVSWQPALVIMLNAVLLWGAGCYMYLLAREIFSPTTAKIAVCLLWLNFSILWALKNPMSWVLEMTAMAAMAYWAWRAWRSHLLRDALALGLCSGLGILSHGVFLLMALLILFCAAVWVVWKKAWAKIPPLALTAVVAAVVVLPWTWRNYLATGKFIPVVVGAGHAYFMGNAITGLPPLNPAIAPKPHVFIYSDDLAALQMAGLDADLMRGTDFGGFPNNDADAQLDLAMAKDLRREPLELIPKSIYNAGQMFFPSIHFLWRSPAYQVATPVSVVVLYDALISFWNLLLWSFAVGGWWNLSTRPQRIGYLIYLGGMAAYALPYLPLTTASNHAAYTFPAYVFLMPLAALGLHGFFCRRRKS